MRSILGKLQRSLSKSALARKLALSVRNQAECILAYYLGESADQRVNGEELVARHFAPHCETFVDVGANAGAWTSMWLRFAPAACRGILFEPLPDMQKELLRLFEGSSITVLNAAAGDEEGTMPLAVDKTFSETSSLVAAVTDHQSVFCPTQVCRLDKVLLEHGMKQVDFLKVDAEGFDSRVLKGARDLISNGAIKTIQFEYNSMWAAAGSTLTETTAWLEQHGYKVFLLRSTGLHKLDWAVFGEFYRYSNFLAVSEEAMPSAREIMARG